VVASGSSAGGFGALANYAAFRWYWPAARSYLLDDSGPPFVGAAIPASSRSAWYACWDLGVSLDPFCPACAALRRPGTEEVPSYEALRQRIEAWGQPLISPPSEPLVPGRRPPMNRLSLSLLLAAAIAGCSAETTTSSKTSLGTVATATLSVELLSDGPLHTGLTPVYVRVKGAGGAMVTDASITLTPVMSMWAPMETQHGAPVIGAPTIDADGLYRFDVVFQMGSMGTDTWSVTVGVTPVGASEEVAYFSPLTVMDTGRARSFVYTDPGTLVESHYVASLDFPTQPRVGLNPVVVTLHVQESMTRFAPVDDASLALDPRLQPSGQASPGSVAPTLVSPGVYAGELSFSSAGEWQTTITVTRGVVVGAPVFTTIF
jgi:hypothetical protein